MTGWPATFFGASWRRLLTSGGSHAAGMGRRRGGRGLRSGNIETRLPTLIWGCCLFPFKFGVSVFAT